MAYPFTPPPPPFSPPLLDREPDPQILVIGTILGTKAYSDSSSGSSWSHKKWKEKAYATFQVLVPVHEIAKQHIHTRAMIKIPVSSEHFHGLAEVKNIHHSTV
jgi:hypothetical protein